MGELDSAHRQSTTEFLTQSDLVKFAQYRPDEPMMYDSLEAAEKLVRETRPMAVAEGAA